MTKDLVLWQWQRCDRVYLPVHVQWLRLPIPYIGEIICQPSSQCTRQNSELGPEEDTWDLW